MRILLYIIFIFLLTKETQGQLAQNITVIKYTNAEKLFNKNQIINTKSGSFEIAYYKEYTLYNVSSVRLEVDHSKTKDTVTKFIPVDTIITYYVAKKNLNYGISYDCFGNTKKYPVDSLLKALAIHDSMKGIYSYVFGKRALIVRNKKTNNITLEKYDVKKKILTDPDTVYKYYDYNLKGINFSFSPTLDKQNNSKLWKILFVFTPQNKKDRSLWQKLEVSMQIEKIKSQDNRNYIKLINRFKNDSKELSLK
ncbi:MAG: hypothetical protein WC622_07110 [Pedobacter sp.]|jgi:hypothetical protein|uniref:hypothetical protein n=1 Tax=Pedobacter sp. TaxID=1411316 RepID=UPI00356637A0